MRHETAAEARPESGFFMIELLVIVALFAIFGLIIAKSHILSMRTTTRALHNSMAMQIAMDEVESWAAVDPNTINDQDNYSDTKVRGNAVFFRSVDFTVNPDGSRTIAINIIGAAGRTQGRASITNTYSMWGTQ